MKDRCNVFIVSAPEAVDQEFVHILPVEGPDEPSEQLRTAKLARRIERTSDLIMLLSGTRREDRLIIALKAVAERRNALPHPKAKQVPRDQPAKDRSGWPIPETAQDQIKAIREFLSEFGRLVPRGRYLREIPKPGRDRHN
jgi:hypothetical protein